MKKYTGILLLLVTNLFYGLIYASEDTEMNRTMVSLGTVMQDIIPLTFDAVEFSKPKSKERLKKDIADLITIFKATPEHFKGKSASFKASYDVMLDHLQHSQTLLNKGDYLVARNMIKAVPSLCVSCHAQDTQNQTTFMGMDRSQFNSDFDYAEFSYVTRDYGMAVTYYDKFLTNKGIYKSEEKTQQALERLLTLYAQIDKKPTIAATYLAEYEKYISDYPALKNNLALWVKGLKNINTYFNEDLLTQQPIQFKTIEDFVNKVLLTNPDSVYVEDEESKVHFVVLRGILYEYLNNKPKSSEEPMLLYWLAMCDRKLNYNFYYSFSDIFLKECFTKYPNHQYAKLCRSEYEKYPQLQASL